MRSPLIRAFTLWIGRHASIASFVETGTWRGSTAVWAKSHFNQVHTLEASSELYERESPLHAAHPDIHFWQGSSAIILPEVLATLSAPAVFWLDAHWSCGDTYGENDECPVLAELAAVNASDPNHIILIDDARYFLAPPPLPHQRSQWPALQDLLGLLSGLPDRPRHVIVVEDVIIAVPLPLRDSVGDWWQVALTQQLAAASPSTPEPGWKRRLRRLLNLS